MNSTVSKQFSALNNSKSKQQYSFPKASRFDRFPSAVYCDNIYNPRNVQNKRAANMGSGQRTKLIGVMNPAPTQYDIKCNFDQLREQRGKRGISFGLGREKVIFGQAMEVNKFTPGPQYSQKSTISNIGYSIRKKTPVVGNNPTFLKSPGPGAYETTKNESQQGFHTLSQFKSTGSRKIPPLRSHSKTIERMPGPGEYDKASGNINGKIVSSRYKSQRSVSFGLSARNTYDKDYINAPGPGSYQTYSEF